VPSTHALPIRLAPCLLVLLVALSGCAGHDDPFQREGTWHVQNINDANLAAMVNDKRQLQVGVGDDASPSALSAQAVHRLLTDHVKPLTSSQVGPFAQPTQSGGNGS
jgi:hypothetical protein